MKPSSSVMVSSPQVWACVGIPLLTRHFFCVCEKFSLEYWGPKKGILNNPLEQINYHTFEKTDCQDGQVVSGARLKDMKPSSSADFL